MPSSLAPTFITLLSDIVDAKARTEYERDRQKAHKGQDIRRKFNGKPSSSSGTTTPKRSGLGHGAWRNSAIALEDMEDPIDIDDPIEDNDFGKENSRPGAPLRQLSVSLEDLVVVRPAATAAQNHKPRKSVSRSSLSRQASFDNLALAFPSPSLTSPPPASLSIISEADCEPSLIPMQPPASPISNNLDDNEYDFSFPVPNAWTMDETEDGSFRFVSAYAYAVFEKADW